ncbi:MAG TPA: PQQ-binding-like beta-propeller repeat protein [Anaerolineales bacterium]
MNTKRVPLILLALLAALVLSSCAGGAAARGTTWPGLAADDQAAYLSDGAQLFAVRLTDGAGMWLFPAKPDAKTSFFATPVLLDGGRLLIGSAGTDHCLYVVDPAKVDQATNAPAAQCIFNGAKDRWIASPLVVNNVAYAPNNDGWLYAVDLGSSKLLWSLEIGGGGHLWATPVSDGKTLYISSLDHHVYAVDMGGKSVLWKADLNGSVTGAPALSADGKNLFVGSFASKAFALDAATGKVLWQTATKDWAWGTPGTDDTSVYVGDLEGQLYALDPATGKVLWSAQPDGPITGGPLLAGDHIIVTTESGSVFAYTTGGQQAWTAAIKGKIYTPAVLAGDKILVAPLASGAEYLLTALSADGKVLWNFKPGK